MENKFCAHGDGIKIGMGNSCSGIQISYFKHCPFAKLIACGGDHSSVSVFYKGLGCIFKSMVLWQKAYLTWTLTLLYHWPLTWQLHHSIHVNSYQTVCINGINK